jgi:hypothetical protein
LISTGGGQGSKNVFQLDAALTRAEVAGVRLRLLRRPPVYLFALSGDGTKFVELFRSAWRRVPRRAKETILRHWRGDWAPIPSVSPLISLLPDWPDRQRDDVAALACVPNQGFEIRFWSRLPDVAPPQIVETVIVHELAHVLRDAEAARDGREPDDDFWHEEEQGWCLSIDELERDVDKLIAKWGFDPRTVEAWAKGAHASLTS